MIPSGENAPIFDLRASNINADESVHLRSVKVDAIKSRLIMGEVDNCQVAFRLANAPIASAQAPELVFGGTDVLR